MKQAGLLCALLLAAPAGAAEPNAEKAVAYRDMMMDAAGAHMGALKMLIKGESQRKQDAAMHATSLHQMGETFIDLFPKGSGPDAVETRAKAEIWSNSEDFKKAARAFTTASKKLADAAKAGDFEAVKVQFGNVGKSCGGCHDGFRAED